MAILMEEVHESARHPLLEDYLFASLAWVPAVQSIMLIAKKR